MSALTHCSVFILAAALCSNAGAQTATGNTASAQKAKTAVPAATPAAIPAYDVYLADLLDGKISNVKKVNANAGYHNQPAFNLTGTELYFTSQQGSGEKSQMDIARYDIKSGTLDLFQSTALSEYSPTVLPADQALPVYLRRQLPRLLYQHSPGALLLPGSIEAVEAHQQAPIIARTQQHAFLVAVVTDQQGIPRLAPQRCPLTVTQQYRITCSNLR